MQLDNVLEFEIPGHATRREWCVYIIIASSQDKSTNFLYVGKVGDNREGCNPIISRIGNHFSHNKIHSQIRNKLGSTDGYGYKVIYGTFGSYHTSSAEEKQLINELERELNRRVQTWVKNTHQFELLNPFLERGWINKEIKKLRGSLVHTSHIDILEKMVRKISL